MQITDFWDLVDIAGRLGTEAALMSLINLRPRHPRESSPEMCKGEIERPQTKGPNEQREEGAVLKPRILALFIYKIFYF